MATSETAGNDAPKNGEAEARQSALSSDSNGPNSSGPDLAAWIALIATLLTAAIYGIFLPNSSFVWDDVAAVPLNPLLESWSGIWKIWTTHGEIPNESHYWPVTYTAFWLQYRFFGEWAPGFRAVSLVFHLINAGLLGWLARRIGLGRLAAAFTFSFFVLHPINAESAITTIEQKDLLALFFSLVAAHLYLLFTAPPDPRRGEFAVGVKLFLAASILLLFWAGMWSKSVAVMLPPALLVLDWWRDRWREKRNWCILGPLFFMAIVLGIIDLKTTLPGTVVDFGLSPFEKLATASRAILFYLIKLIAPFRITTLYPAWEVDTANPVFGASIAICIGILIGLIWLANIGFRGPLAAFIIFVIAAFPTLGFLEISTLRFSWVANRFIYWGNSAMAILAGTIVAGLIQIAQRRRKEIPALVAISILVLFYLLQAGYQAWRLQAEPILWESNMQVAPKSPHVYANYSSSLAKLAVDLTRAGYRDEAYTLLKKAEASWEIAFALIRENGTVDPHLEGDTAANLGQTHQKLGNYSRAVRFYYVAYEEGRASLATLNNLAWLLATAPDADSRNGGRALRMLEEAERKAGGAAHPQVLDTRAAVLAELGQFPEAMEAAGRAWTLAKKAGNQSLAAEIEGRLLLYRRKQPFRLPKVSGQ